MLTNTEKQKIINHFGSAFYQRMRFLLQKYTEMWCLEQVEWIEYLSVNCLFTCHSKIYGGSVLKICRPAKEVITEIQTLREYDGTLFCKIFAFDIKDSVLLEEAITPGTPLRAVTSVEERIKIFLSLYAKLHISPKTPEKYPTYAGWVERITNFMATQKAHTELYPYMRKAYDVFQRIHEKYNRTMLLHGDFHHDNILLGADGLYTIIDPKGVVGDPILDIPRFILNECSDKRTYEENAQHIAHVIARISAGTSLPVEDIRNVFFVEMAMANCWCVEDSEKPNMDDVKMAYGMLHCPDDSHRL